MIIPGCLILFCFCFFVVVFGVFLEGGHAAQFLVFCAVFCIKLCVL